MGSGASQHEIKSRPVPRFTEESRQERLREHEKKLRLRQDEIKEWLEGNTKHAIAVRQSRTRIENELLGLSEDAGEQKKQNRQALLMERVRKRRAAQKRKEQLASGGVVVDVDEKTPVVTEQPTPTAEAARLTTKEGIPGTALSGSSGEMAADPPVLQVRDVSSSNLTPVSDAPTHRRSNPDEERERPAHRKRPASERPASNHTKKEVDAHRRGASLEALQHTAKRTKERPKPQSLSEDTLNEEVSPSVNPSPKAGTSNDTTSAEQQASNSKDTRSQAHRVVITPVEQQPSSSLKSRNAKPPPLVVANPHSPSANTQRTQKYRHDTARTPPSRLASPVEGASSPGWRRRSPSKTSPGRSPGTLSRPSSRAQEDRSRHTPRVDDGTTHMLMEQNRLLQEQLGELRSLFSQQQEQLASLHATQRQTLIEQRQQGKVLDTVSQASVSRPGTALLNSGATSPVGPGQALFAENSRSVSRKTVRSDSTVSVPTVNTLVSQLFGGHGPPAEESKLSETKQTVGASLFSLPLLAKESSGGGPYGGTGASSTGLMKDLLAGCTSLPEWRAIQDTVAVFIRDFVRKMLVITECQQGPRKAWTSDSNSPDPTTNTSPTAGAPTAVGLARERRQSTAGFDMFHKQLPGSRLWTVWSRAMTPPVHYTVVEQCLFQECGGRSFAAKWFPKSAFKPEVLGPPYISADRLQSLRVATLTLLDEYLRQVTPSLARTSAFFAYRRAVDGVVASALEKETSVREIGQRLSRDRVEAARERQMRLAAMASDGKQSVPSDPSSYEDWVLAHPTTARFWDSRNLGEVPATMLVRLIEQDPSLEPLLLSLAGKSLPTALRQYLISRVAFGQQAVGQQARAVAQCLLKARYALQPEELEDPPQAVNARLLFSALPATVTWTGSLRPGEPAAVTARLMERVWAFATLLHAHGWRGNTEFMPLSEFRSLMRTRVSVQQFVDWKACTALVRVLQPVCNYLYLAQVASARLQQTEDKDGLSSAPLEDGALGPSLSNAQEQDLYDMVRVCAPLVLSVYPGAPLPVLCSLARGLMVQRGPRRRTTRVSEKVLDYVQSRDPSLYSHIRECFMGLSQQYRLDKRSVEWVASHSLRTSAYESKNNTAPYPAAAECVQSMPSFHLGCQVALQPVQLVTRWLDMLFVGFFSTPVTLYLWDVLCLSSWRPITSDLRVKTPPREQTARDRKLYLTVLMRLCVLLIGQLRPWILSARSAVELDWVFTVRTRQITVQEIREGVQEICQWMLSKDSGFQRLYREYQYILDA